MIRSALALTLLFATALAHAAASKEAMLENREWGAHFEKFGASGTIVIVDERQSPAVTRVFDGNRAQRRYSPASTFKIPHTLFALDAGVVKDEFQVFTWDRVQRSFSGHNQDQTLRSAMRNSTLWVYEQFAKSIGETRARAYLRGSSYGNADPTTSGGAYWVDGNLRISAVEQVEFLRKLFRNALPFKIEHQRLVKDLMIREAQPHWILRAKTGWEGRYGWWVGWVETAEGAVFFALNIDTPRRMDDLPKREQVTRAILQSMGLLD
jgi:beta-lactamase class D OXA-2